MKKRAQRNKKRIRWASVLTVFVLLIGIIAIAFAGVHLLSPKTNTSPGFSLVVRIFSASEPLTVV